MNMMTKKFQRTTALSPIDGDDVLAVLDRRLRELQAERVRLTEEIIEDEKTASHPAVSADLAQAEAMLEGADFIPSRERPISRLAANLGKREIIDAALRLGSSRQHRLATERAGEIWAAHFPEIAEIEKRRVMLALDLQRTNRQREVLREKITAAGGAGYLSTDSVDLLGLGDVEEDVKWAAERVISDGIATRDEIEKAKS
jgi:hypothetical protein